MLYSVSLIHFRGIAQLVEQWSPKPRAQGSSPCAPAICESLFAGSHFLFFEYTTKYKNFYINFGGDDSITREQFAAMLYHCVRIKRIWYNLGRYGSKRVFKLCEHLRLCGGGGNLGCKCGQHKGMGGGTLNPQGRVTRAQTAQMFVNFYQNAAK